MEIKAKARFIKTAPDKIRILAEVLKKRKIDEALAQLTVVNKVGAKSLSLVLKQAKGQIKDKNKEVEDFHIKSLQVDEGPKLKRRRIVHKGRATMVLKRMSHVVITLADNENPKSEISNAKQKVKNSKVKNKANIEKPALSDGKDRNGTKS